MLTKRYTQFTGKCVLSNKLSVGNNRSCNTTHDYFTLMETENWSNELRSSLSKHNSSIWSNQNTPLLPNHQLSVED